jgi:SOS-response transcriptional repressor LexA
MSSENNIKIDYEGFVERVRQCLSASNIPQIAEKLGLEKQTVYNWQKGSLPRPEKIEQIANLGQVSLDWLLTGNEKKPIKFHLEPYADTIQRLANQEGIDFESTVKKLIREALHGRNALGEGVEQPGIFNPGMGVIWIPLLGKIAAGRPIERIPQVQMIAVADSYPKHWKMFALVVEGDSMKDRGIHEGDRLVCASERSPTKGDVVVALIDGEESTVKTYEARDGKILLKPANPEFKTMEYDPERVYLQGVVLEVIRKAQR